MSPAGRQAATRQPLGHAGSLLTLPPARSRGARQSGCSPRILESGASFPWEALSGCRFYSLVALLRLDTLPWPLGSPLFLGFLAGSSKQLDPVTWEAPDDRVAGVPTIQAPRIPSDRCAWTPALAPPTQILGLRSPPGLLKNSSLVDSPVSGAGRAGVPPLPLPHVGQI